MKKNLSILFSGVMILSMLLSSCAPKPSASIARSELKRVTDPNASQTDLQQLVAGNTAFALDLYKSLSSTNDNLFASPYSISLALAMTYAGARGQTAAQMASTMHFDLDAAQLHPAFNALDLELASRQAEAEKNKQQLQLSIANSLWGQQDFTFRQEFLDLLAQDYGAGMRLVDYKSASEQARLAINQWVEDQTNQKIKNLIPQGVLDAMTRLVLVNAIYFKASWEHGFDANRTGDAPFTLLDGSQAQVKMMHFSEPEFLQYAQGDGWQAVALPYQGNNTEMDILLPDAGSFAAFEQGLTADKLNEILGSLGGHSVDLSMPKFSFTDETLLKGTLAGMGMTDAFDANKADLSGMDGQPDLYITEVVHKAFINVDETGTEAAAATGVIVGLTAARVTDVTMQVDRPFIFVIRDVPTGTILFIGRVLNPAG